MLGCEARRNPFMMFRKWIIAAVAVALIGPAWLTAQQPPRPPAPPRPPRQPRAFVFADDNRGRIGVVVKTQPDSEADKLGAKLEGVTPGGRRRRPGPGAVTSSPRSTARRSPGSRGRTRRKRGLALSSCSWPRSPDPGTRFR